MADEQQDPVMGRIAEAVELGRAGDGDAARQRLTEIWDEIGPERDPFHRCVLADYAETTRPTCSQTSRRS